MAAARQCWAWLRRTLPLRDGCGLGVGESDAVDGRPLSPISIAGGESPRVARRKARCDAQFLAHGRARPTRCSLVHTRAVLLSQCCLRAYRLTRAPLRHGSRPRMARRPTSRWRRVRAAAAALTRTAARWRCTPWTSRRRAPTAPCSPGAFCAHLARPLRALSPASSASSSARARAVPPHAALARTPRLRPPATPAQPDDVCALWLAGVGRARRRPAERRHG